MRDLHMDGEFLRDFNEASKQWSWAAWHEVRAVEEMTVRRLLEQVFGASDTQPPTGDISEGER